MSDLTDVAAREQRLLGDLNDRGAREQHLLDDLRDAGAREQRQLANQRDAGVREQRLHADLSAVLRELRSLQNDTQERARRTVRHVRMQCQERISSCFPGLSAGHLEAAAAQLDRRGRAGAREDAGARLPAGSPALHPLLHAAVKLARVGVLNKDDLVEELALALTAPGAEQDDKELQELIRQGGLVSDVDEALAAVLDTGAAQTRPSGSSFKRRCTAESRLGSSTGEIDISLSSNNSSTITSASSRSSSASVMPSETGAPLSDNVVTMSSSLKEWPESTRFTKPPSRAATLICSAAPGSKAADMLCRVINRGEMSYAFQAIGPDKFRTFMTVTNDGHALGISTGARAAVFTLDSLVSALEREGLWVQHDNQPLPLPLCRLHKKPCKLAAATQGQNEGRSFYTCALIPSPGTKSANCTFLWNDGLELHEPDWRARLGLPAAQLRWLETQYQDEPHQHAHLAMPQPTQQYGLRAEAVSPIADRASGDSTGASSSSGKQIFSLLSP